MVTFQYFQSGIFKTYYPTLPWYLFNIFNLEYLKHINRPCHGNFSIFSIWNIWNISTGPAMVIFQYFLSGIFKTYQPALPWSFFNIFHLEYLKPIIPPCHSHFSIFFIWNIQKWCITLIFGFGWCCKKSNSCVKCYGELGQLWQ